MKTAVIIARFQTPYLHEGPKQLISMVKENHAKLIILLGVSPLVGSRKNPYDYYTREKMIKKDYPEVIVLPVSDHPSDKTWSESIDSLLKGVFPNEHFCLFGSRDSFIPYYSGRFETIELPEHGDYNATELRKHMQIRYSILTISAQVFCMPCITSTPRFIQPLISPASGITKKRYY
jgi:bifunctional NMN adenylyltransferase/nudix hydrolase